MTKQMIVNMNTTDPVNQGQPVFWSDEFGWGDALEADIFGDQGPEDWPLGGKFCSVEDAAYFLNPVGFHNPNMPAEMDEKDRENFILSNRPK